MWDSACPLGAAAIEARVASWDQQLWDTKGHKAVSLGSANSGEE